LMGDVSCWIPGEAGLRTGDRLAGTSSSLVFAADDSEPLMPEQGPSMLLGTFLACSLDGGLRSPEDGSGEAAFGEVEAAELGEGAEPWVISPIENLERSSGAGITICGCFRIPNKLTYDELSDRTARKDS
jgi:hypothetical protein